MGIRPIVCFPDRTLMQVCAPVVQFDADLRALADDMLATMYAAPGRGLAGPQVGALLRIFVMDVTWKTGTPTPQVFVNPQIVASSDDVVTQDEGCLSIPGRVFSITRPAKVGLEWQDLAGDVQRGEFDDFAAACVQHEIDHLDGILINAGIKD